MGGRHSHPRRTESLSDEPVTIHPGSQAGSIETEDRRTVCLVAPPTVEILPPLAGVFPINDSMEVIAEENTRSRDSSRGPTSSMRANASSWDSGSENSEPSRPPFVGKAFDSPKAINKPDAPENTLTPTTDAVLDSDGASDIATTSATAAPDRGHTRHQVRRHTGLSAVENASAPPPPVPFRAERVSASVALVTVALGALFVEGCNAWHGGGLLGVFKACLILIACIFDTVWNGIVELACRIWSTRQLSLQPTPVSDP